MYIHNSIMDIHNSIIFRNLLAIMDIHNWIIDIHELNYGYP